MTKIYKLNKIIYTIIFSMITILVFLIEFRYQELIYDPGENPLIKFLYNLEFSFKSFDIMYVTLWAFIGYFYYNTYFDGKKYNKKNLTYTILAVIFTILTLIGKSYLIDYTLSSLYKHNIQIFKTVVFALGYYLMYYAIKKKVSNIKFDNIILKKKRQS